jgi:hypothetical protein
MPVPTVAASNALSRLSELRISNHSAAYLRVASLTTTTVTVDNSDTISGKTLYASANPGLLVVHEGVAGSDIGLTANITGFSGNVLTVSVDLTADLADGDIIAVYPPHAMKIATNGGHGLQYTSSNEMTKGYGNASLVHNTPHTADLGGPIGFYFPIDTHQVTRLLATFFGAYKKSGTGQHDLVFVEDNDGTYTDLSRFSAYSKESNGAIEHVFGNLFSTGLTINFAEGSPITGSIDTMGNVYSREVGGTGKTFPTGANNYVVASLPCEAGQRYTSVGTFVEFGGSFGSALSDSRETLVTSLTINGSRNADAPRPLGSAYVVNPEETTHDFSLSLTRVMNANTLHDRFLGASTDAQAVKTETRVLVTLVPVTPGATQSISFDMPRAIVNTHEIQRPDGRTLETVTIIPLHTLNASDCIDTASPLVRCRLVTGVDTDIGTSLS